MGAAGGGWCLVDSAHMAGPYGAAGSYYRLPWHHSVEDYGLADGLMR